MPSAANCWKKQMSTKLSLKEALAARDRTKASARDRSASPRVRLILRAGDITRPVDLARLLTKHGVSLRKSHETLNRLVDGESVAIELQVIDTEMLCSKFSQLGVSARTINLPTADVKQI